MHDTPALTSPTPADGDNKPLFRQFPLNKRLYYSNKPVPIKGVDILEIDIGEGHQEDDHSDDEVGGVHYLGQGTRARSYRLACRLFGAL